MADKELDKNQQEEDIDIDALFAKMMADKAASGEEIKQAKEDPEKPHRSRRLRNMPWQRTVRKQKRSLQMIWVQKKHL